MTDSPDTQTALRSVDDLLPDEIVTIECDVPWADDLRVVVTDSPNTPTALLAFDRGEYEANRLAGKLPPEPQQLRWWGSDCIIEGGCDGNTTPDSMRCDTCGSNRYTVPLYVEAS